MTDQNSTPRVIIIVVNWRQREWTDRCIQSLQKLEYTNYRIVVVDNASQDGSAEWLAGRYPDIQLLQTSRNAGFAGGSNFALRQILNEAPDYVWLVNNDAIALPDALAALVRTAESDASIGAVGSVLFDADGSDSVQVWGGGMVSFLSGLPRHLQQPPVSQSMDYIIGASLLLKWKALEQIGFLEEQFFLYWEDVDLCFRLRKAGWNLAVADQSKLTHAGSASIRFQSPQWDFHFTASSILFFRRHSRFPILPIFISGGGRLIHRCVQGRWENARAVWRAILGRPPAVESLDA